MFHEVCKWENAQLLFQSLGLVEVTLMSKVFMIMAEALIITMDIRISVFKKIQMKIMINVLKYFYLNYFLLFEK